MSCIKKIYYFSGTHWDREWYKSFQGFRFMLVDTIDRVIDTLDNDSDFSTFVLDGQTIILEDYSEIKPERVDSLKKLISNGRIKVGPWYVMPDEFLVSGESIIRNLQIGHGIALKYNAPDVMKYGYVCDIFGHIGQLPQILSGFGIKGALLGRGTNSADTPSHFLWKSYGGDSVITFKVPESFGYGSFWRDVWEEYLDGSNTDWSSLISRACKYIDNETQRSDLPYIVLMDSMDHTDINPFATKLAKELSQIYDCPVVFESPENMVNEISAGNYDLPVRSGELNKTTKELVEHSMLIPHTLSSRYDIKLQNDITQTLLEKWALPMQAMQSIFAGSDESSETIPLTYIDVAYRYLISCQAHDSICGCSIDDVHRDMHYRFRQAQSIAEEVIFRYITLNLDSKTDLAERESFDIISEPQVPVIKLDIWNPLVFERHEEVVADIFFDKTYPTAYHEQGSPEKINSFRILDSKGDPVAYAIRNISRGKYVRTHYASYRQTKDVYTVSFEATLSALGKTGYYVVPDKKPARYLSTLATETDHVSNDWFDLSVNDNGTIDLFDRKHDRHYRNLISFLDDGELGDGWFHVTPVSNSVISSNGSPTIIERISNGPSCVVFRVTKSMQTSSYTNNRNGDYLRSSEHETYRITTDITVSGASPYIDFHTVVHNTSKDHRLRLVLPTDIKADKYYVDQAFSFVERETGFDLGSADWKEYDKIERSFESMVFKKDNEGKGLLFISKGGLHECAVPDDSHGSVMVTLFRSFGQTFLTNGEPDGQLLSDLEFEYRLMPFGEETSFADMIRSRDSFQTGIRSYSYVLSDNFSAGIPDRIQTQLKDTPLFKLINDDLIVSIAKSPNASDVRGLIIRLYNPCDRPVNGSVKFLQNISGCYETDLNERQICALRITDNEVSLDFSPFEIRTLLIN
ncbi:MAG: glycoside hydrolase family 38 C-terminal domain-containing protein [Eubacteriales bacterium]|nr:glycoside hydrolase family 38 C-terminal domain-containing protein [Eubacteriales bacterium]